MTITRKEIEDGMILFCKSGSHAYGLNTESSDLDYKGICIAPKRFYITFQEFQQKDKGWDQEDYPESPFPQLNGSDSVVYEIRRYLQLLFSQNPNILEMLWQEPDDYIHLTESARILINNRHRLISRRIAGTFIQYARAQIKKMETHRKWLLNPPTKAPEWSDYDMSVPALTKTQTGAFLEYLYLLIKDRMEYYYPAKELYDILNEKVDWKGVLKQHVLPEDCVEMTQEMTRATPEYMVLLRKSQEYHSDLKRWNSYQDWLKNRNPQRSEIERQCGYDGKNASHCVRLMKMAIEALKTGELIVNRNLAGDRELLMSIKTGRLSYVEVNQMVNDLFTESEHVLHNQCVLPRTIDYDFVNELCEQIVSVTLG